jgi:hypothetical protein
VNIKKAFPIALMLLGLVFLGAGVYTVSRGFDAKDQVRDELIAQNITTPDDASIPGVVVNSPARAKSMADIIDKHALETTGGLTYSEMDRDDPNRQVAFQAASLRTSLYTSVMAFEVANLVLGLGAMIVVLGLAVGGVGIALAGLTIPTVARRVHTPVLAES